MINRRLFFPVLTLIVGMLACGTPTEGLPPTGPGGVTASRTAAPPEAGLTDTPALFVPSAVPALTLELLRNGTYTAPAYQRTVTLTDGAYSENLPEGSFSVQMLDVYALGDLNGDGLGDAAILLAENGGGSGVFESLVVLLNQGGVPHQAGQAQLGDRVQVNTVSIASGQISIELVVQAPGDPLCCPTQAETQTYRLVEGVLWLTRLTTRTPSGVERVISIASPVNGTGVGNPFTVRGSLTVSPFEDALVYRIYLPGGTLVNEYGMSVDSSGLGTAGTFRQSINLGNAGISGTIIVQILDRSAADGSTLAMDSVILVIQ